MFGGARAGSEHDDGTPRKKVAILGGGVGSMTAAFELTQEPDWQDKYDITVYQLGWRLGGKGASGRDRKRGARILEHGLHVWGGYYDNSFRVMRECYDALQRPPTCRSAASSRPSVG